MPSSSGWSSGRAPLAISECATGMSRCSARASSACRGGRVAQPAADVDQRPLGLDQQPGDPVGDVVGQAGPPGVGGQRVAGSRIRRDGPGEDVHRHVEQHRARPPRGGGPERALGEPGQVLGPVHVPGPLGERPVDRGLVGVGVQVDFLVRVPARVVGGHVAADGDQRYRVERGGGHAGDRVHHARPDVQQQYARLPGHPGVPVGGVRGRLLVPGDDELDRAAAERVEQRDVRVPAGAEHVLAPRRTPAAPASASAAVIMCPPRRWRCRAAAASWSR